MIEYLTGNVVKRHAKGIVLNVAGVGYGLELPLGALCEIGVGSGQESFWIHTRVREDQLKLFGFTTWEEKGAFEVLISLNGVGPKVALALLSTMSLAMLRTCVEDKRVDLLQMIPGVGKRTAEKMLVELSGKVDKIPAMGSSSSFSEITIEQKQLDFDSANQSEESRVHSLRAEVLSDVKSALMNLGFKEKDIIKVEAIAQIEDIEPEQLEFSSILRSSLVELRGGLSNKKGSKVKRSSPAVDENTLF
jgi:holliday junction DNA helicase RuvA